MTTRSPAATSVDTDEDVRRGVIGAGIAVTAWGSTSVITKSITMGGLAVAAYRFGIYGVAVLAFLALRGTPLPWRVMRRTFLGGVALAADVALFFSAIKLTTIANATVIGALQPLVVTAAAVAFFGEKVRSREVALGLVALAGVVVVIVGSAGAPEWNPTGDLLAVGALISWSGYFIFSKQSRRDVTPFEFTTGTAVWTALFNGILAFAIGQDLSLPSLRNWLLLVGLALVGGAIGHTLMNWSLVRIPMWLGSVTTLLIPVVASAIAWLVLDEPLTVLQGVGMALTLLALGLIVRGQTTNAKLHG